jgi:hypothetical protein
MTPSDDAVAREVEQLGWSPGPDDLSDVPAGELAAQAQAARGRLPVVVRGPAADRDRLIAEALPLAGDAGVLFIPDEIHLDFGEPDPPHVLVDRPSVDRIEDLPESWRPPDGYKTERLAADLAFVREQLASYRRQEADLVAAIAERMRNQQEHPGPWRIERNWSAPRKHWQSQGLVAELAKMARVTPDGEQRSDAEARQWFIDAMLDCVPFTESLGWRVGGRPGRVGLRDYGLDPDEWCEKGEGHWTVAVTYDPEGPAT